MFKNLSEKQKEEKFELLLSYANKIRNEKLKKVCFRILNDYKLDILCRSAGHDGIVGIPAGKRSHQNFDGGLIDHILNVVTHSYNIAKVYKDEIDIDLVLFGAILHDIGKVKIFDEWNEKATVKGNLNFRYLLVDHCYIGQQICERYLDEEKVDEKLKYQALHIIATHMDTMEKHMTECYIVSYADSIDADVMNCLSYPRNAINPITKNYIYKSENK